MFTSPRVHETRCSSTHGVWPNRQTPNITRLSLISSTNDAGLASLLSVITRRCLFRPFVLSASLLWPTNRSGTTPKSISADLLPQLLTLSPRQTHFTTHISCVYLLYRTPLPLLVSNMVHQVWSVASARTVYSYVWLLLPEELLFTLFRWNVPSDTYWVFPKFVLKSNTWLSNVRNT